MYRTGSYKARMIQYRKYHIVAKADVKMRAANATLCLKEIKARQKFTKRYYHDRYDGTHKHWMHALAKNISLHSRINMSLDDLVAVMKAEEIK